MFLKVRAPGFRPPITGSSQYPSGMAVFLTSTATLFGGPAALLSRPAALLTRPALPTPAPRCTPPVLRAGDTNLWSAVPWKALTNLDPIAIVEAQLASLQDGNVASCYHLASPGFRRAAGSAQKFEQVVRENPEYAPPPTSPPHTVHPPLRTTHQPVIPTPAQVQAPRQVHAPRPGRRGCPPSYLGATAASTRTPGLACPSLLGILLRVSPVEALLRSSPCTAHSAAQPQLSPTRGLGRPRAPPTSSPPTMTVPPRSTATALLLLLLLLLPSLPLLPSPPPPLPPPPPPPLLLLLLLLLPPLLLLLPHGQALPRPLDAAGAPACNRRQTSL